MLHPLVQIDAVIDTNAHAQRQHRQRGHLQTDAKARHQRVAQGRHDGQRRDDAQHGAERAERQPAEQRHRTEQRAMHLHLGLLDRLVGRRHYAGVAAGQLELHLALIDTGEDALDLRNDMLDGLAAVILQEHQDLHRLAAVEHQAVRLRVSHRAGLQPALSAGNRRPARIAFVIAGDGHLAHPRHALDRLHAGDAAGLEIHLLHRAHHVGVQTGLLNIRHLGIDRQHIEADRIAADDLRVVPVVARGVAQLGRVRLLRERHGHRAPVPPRIPRGCRNWPAACAVRCL